MPKLHNVIIQKCSIFVLLITGTEFGIKLNACLWNALASTKYSIVFGTIILCKYKTVHDPKHLLIAYFKIKQSCVCYV